MINLNYHRISFNETLVLLEGELHIDYGMLTVLKGESGSGKSTLLETLAYHNEFIKEYQLDDFQLNEMEEEKRFAVLFENVSFIEQDNDLLESLTIRDQIHMVGEFSESSSKPKTWIALLALEDLLDKYPAQLSGGEQKRVSILLALVKCPRILVLDEPTASLDETNRFAVLRVLKEYAKIGNAVFVATHDEELAINADVVYKIESHVLIEEIKTSKNQNESSTNLKVKKNIYAIIPYFRKMKHHNKFYKKLINSLTILCISLISFSFAFNNIAYTNTKAQMDEMQTTQLVIYKNFFQTQSNDFYGFGSYDIINKSELNQVRKVPHIKAIDWRFDVSLNDPFTKPLYWNEKERNTFNTTVILKDGNDKDFTYDGSSIILSTYSKKADYKSDIQEKYQDEGVYISKDLASNLSSNGNSLNGKSLTVNVLIPIAFSYGKCWTITPEKENLYIHQPVCVEKVMTLPIAGVLKESSMGIKNTYEEAIYYDQSILENLIQQKKPKTYDKYYIMDDMEKEIFIHAVPDNRKKDILHEVQYSPWSPTSYTVTVDSLTHMDEVIEKLSKLGFSVGYMYENYKAINQTTIQMQKALQIVSAAVAVLITLFYIAMKLNNREEEKKINLFFYRNSFTSSEIKKIKRMKYICQTIMTLIWSVVWMSILLMVCNYMGLGFTSYSISMFVTVIMISLLAEFVLPMALEKDITKKII